MITWCLRFLGMALACAVLLARPVQAEPTAQEIAILAGHVLDDDLGAQVMRACPADYHARHMTWRAKLFGASSSWSIAKCRKDMTTCTETCISQRNGKACFSLARILEMQDNKTHDMARRTAFALACAYGTAGGCTNRGAGLRNAPRSDDRLTLGLETDLEQCLAQTFATACKADNPWGCAMSGQAYHLGEGVPRNAPRAGVQYAKACALSGSEAGKQTESAPCRFARRKMKQLAPEQKDSP